VACGTLVAAATDANIRALQSRSPDSQALEKYADAGRLFSRDPGLSRDDAWRRLVEVLDDWTHRMRLARLRNYGLEESAVEKVVANCRGSSMKTNPVVLTDAEVAGILRTRL
jgi:alcohol dehydrogenase